MDGIAVRAMEGADAPRMERFFDRLGEDGSRFFNGGDGNRRYVRRVLSNEETTPSLHWVAVRGDDILGYVFLTGTDTSIPWLGIALREEAKGSGLSSVLMEKAKGYVRDSGKGGILLITHPLNARARRFYERCGFELLGTHDSTGEKLYCWRRA